MPLPASSLKHQAKQLLQAQRLNEARLAYEQLCTQPDADADDWGSLGMIHGMLGAWQQAEVCCRKALALNAKNSAAHCNLGVVLETQGRPAEAADCYRAALRLSPNESQLYANLGGVLRMQDKFTEARDCYQQGLQHVPDDAGLHLGLGVIHEAMGNLAAAQTCYERAHSLNPNDAEAHYNLGNVLLAQERPSESVGCYQEAIRLQPRHAGAHNNLGRAQVSLGRLRDAEASYRRAVEINPEHAGAHNNLGNVLSDLGRSDEAIGSFQAALRIRPEYAEAFNNLGNAYHEKNLLAQAIECFTHAVSLKPDFAEALNNLGRALRSQGKLQEGLEAFRRALRADPDYADAHSNLLYSLNNDAGHTPQAIFAEHKRWGELHGHPQAVLPPPANPPDPARRLRIGYVSPDLRAHSVAYFLEPILARHDRENFEIYAYAEVPEAKYDATSKRLHGLCDHWLTTCGFSDADLARRIRQDGIDILIDLAGHTAHNRLRCFAHRPAPVQISYLGYPNTTGLATIDYRLTDAWADPPGQEALHTERLVRLASGFLCYTPAGDAAPVGELPALGSDHITFGSFNNFSKLTPQTVELWARLMKHLPGSRLILKNKSLSDAGTAAHCVAGFASRGIGPERLELIGWLPSRREHLALYARIDIGLDSFPYNGTTTTCEALWMGVPVIALAGDRHAARVGVGLLSQVGLQELIADTPERYVEIARDLSSDLSRLADLRKGLRQRMLTSSLCDAPAFTRVLEKAYRELWRRWCETQ